MAMMNWSFENVQQLGREWTDYSRRVSRDALRAMSGQLENAARYLTNLSSRLERSDQNGASAAGEAAEQGGESHRPEAHN